MLSVRMSPHLSAQNSAGPEDLERFRTLRRRGTVTPLQLNEAEDRFRETEGRVQVLEAQHAETEARLEAARQDVQLLRLQLEKAEIRAPVSCTVITKAIERGKLASPAHAVAVLGARQHAAAEPYSPQGTMFLLARCDYRFCSWMSCGRHPRIPALRQEYRSRARSRP
jgi:multidrug efflux pump subunit AcrA (membrane-fusion protein)